jgi:hypothetical protein
VHGHLSTANCSDLVESLSGTGGDVWRCQRLNQTEIFFSAVAFLTMRKITDGDFSGWNRPLRL